MMWFIQYKQICMKKEREKKERINDNMLLVYFLGVRASILLLLLWLVIQSAAISASFFFLQSVAFFPFYAHLERTTVVSNRLVVPF